MKRAPFSLKRQSRSDLCRRLIVGIGNNHSVALRCRLDVDSRHAQSVAMPCSLVGFACERETHKARKRKSNDESARRDSQGQPLDVQMNERRRTHARRFCGDMTKINKYHKIANVLYTFVSLQYPRRFEKKTFHARKHKRAIGFVQRKLRHTQLARRTAHKSIN